MDFVDILLSLTHQPNDLQNHQDATDRTNVKAIIIEMIGASFDTSSTTVEWAMSQLLRHPTVMKRLQQELEHVVGINRHVEKMTSECKEDVTIDGYLIKKKTRVMVNAWTIGRDPKVWDRAEIFDPTRFENNNVDVRGKDFRILPFGSGRRGCPGIHLGLTTISLVLAELVHCFDWKLSLSMSCDELDMEEIFGLTTPRKKHLLTRPIYRLAI